MKGNRVTLTRARKQRCYTFPFFQHCLKVNKTSKLLQKGRVKSARAKLADLMIEHDVGVSKVGSYEVKKIDLGFFTES